MHNRKYRPTYTHSRWLTAAAPVLWLFFAGLLPAQEPEPAAVEAPSTEVVAPEPPEAPLYRSRRERDHQLLAVSQPQDVHWLNTPNGPVPALYRASEARAAKGALLMLHTADQPPGWPPLLEQLRQNLPLHGWATLALTLPDPAPAAIPPRPPEPRLSTENENNPENPEDSPPVEAPAPAQQPAPIPEPGPARAQLIAERLAAAQALLRERGQYNVILLVDNASAREVLSNLTPALQASARQAPPSTGNSPLREPIRALILVNMQAQQALTGEDLAVVFGVPQLPVMDVFFAPESAQQALVRRRHRAEAMRARVVHYQPMLLPQPTLAHQSEPLAFWSQRVRGFMQTQALGVEHHSPGGTGVMENEP